MALDRIGPTTRPLGIPDRPQAQPGEAQPARAPDDLLDADFAIAPAPPGAVGLLVEGPDGQPLPQSGLDALAAALAADTPNANDPAAMRPNQLFLSRQLIWQPPDANMMATSWLVMVRTYAEQRAAWLEQANGQHVPSSLFMADHTPPALREGRPAPLVTELEPWRFAVYAWGAEKLVLRVIVKSNEHSSEQRRRRPRIALRLELMLPGVGRVVIQMEPAGSGVVLEVGAAQTSAMQHMREMLPQMASTVSRTGLTILRCRLLRELPPVSSEQSYPTRLQAASLAPVLFKAMAELAVLLSQPLPPDDLFSESA